MSEPLVDPPATPKPALLFWRALRRRCPVCGQGRLFRRWFLMVDRCPRCGFRFERVEGHWIGAIGMNTIVSFGLLLVVLVGGILVTYPDVEFGPLAVACGLTALLTPLLFHPFSRTLWTAVDLWMTPLGPEDLPPVPD